MYTGFILLISTRVNTGFGLLVVEKLQRQHKTLSLRLLLAMYIKTLQRASGIREIWVHLLSEACCTLHLVHFAMGSQSGSKNTFISHGRTSLWSVNFLVEFFFFLFFFHLCGQFREGLDTSERDDIMTNPGHCVLCGTGLSPH